MSEAAREARIVQLAARFRELGAPDPRAWAESEVDEDIPQLARFVFLRSLWPQLIDSWREEVGWLEVWSKKSAAVRELAKSPEDRQTLGLIAATVAHQVVANLLFRIDEGYDPHVPEDCPGWVLLESTPDGSVTGREVGGLHESLLSLDPSGREGRDLL